MLTRIVDEARIQVVFTDGLASSSGARQKFTEVEIKVDEDGAQSGGETDHEESRKPKELLDFVEKRARKTLKDAVSEENLSVGWAEPSRSYFVMLSLTVVAARFLCHLARAGHPLLKELDIAAVLLGAECIGMDRLVLDEKLEGLPDSSRTREWWARSVRLAKLTDEIRTNMCVEPILLPETREGEWCCAGDIVLPGHTFDDWLGQHGLCRVPVGKDVHCQFRAERVPWHV
jgi:hypothetical protein